MLKSGWDWLDLAITIVLWGTGMLIARRRQVSVKGQIVFSLAMLAMSFPGLLLRTGLSLPMRVPLVSIIFVLAAALFWIGRGFYRRKRIPEFLFVACGISLVFLAFALRAGYVVSAWLFGIGFVLVLGSPLVTLILKRLEKK
jgi:hypothetical protein